jgi:hypothetical protein
LHQACGPNGVVFVVSSPDTPSVQDRGNYYPRAGLSLSAMPDRKRKRIADEIIESISEDPEIEPGQADNTPSNENKPEPKEDQREDDPADHES